MDSGPDMAAILTLNCLSCLFLRFNCMFELMIE